MSSINGEDRISVKDDKADTPSDKESAIESRVARDSENGGIVTEELSPDHTCTADKSCSEQDALENKSPSQNDKSLPDVITSSQEVDKSIKSPPIETSQTNNGSEVEKIPDQENVKDSSPTTDDNDKWLDILGSGHLKKKIIQEGEPNSRPTPSCQVTIRTKGTLEDTSKTVDVNDSVTFAAGEGDVVQAWDLVVSLMCKGEICLVKTSARFAYGEFGREPDVPPNAGIIYELKLLEVNEPIDVAMIPEEEMLSLVDAKCNRGNWLFQRREYLQAVSSYQKGNNFLKMYMEREEGEEDYVMSSAVRNMRVRCLNNLAATQLKTNAYKECLDSCEKVLAIDKDNVKALFRYGKVMLRKGESANAIQYLRRALELSPNEKVIKAELQEAVKLNEANKKKEKDLYKKMVQGLQNDNPKSEEKHYLNQSNSSKWGAYAIAAAVVAVIGIGIFYYFQNHRQ